MYNSTPENIAWLAGIIDGEGCITCSYKPERKTVQFKLQVKSTSMPMIHKISHILTSLGVTYHYQQETGGDKKPAVAVALGGLDHIELVLRATLPHVVTKLREYDTILRYAEWRKNFPKHTSNSNITSKISQMQSLVYQELKRLKEYQMDLTLVSLEPSTPVRLRAVEKES